MERIIGYNELPEGKGKSIYLRFETDPKLYLTLFSKGYRIVNNVKDAEDKTIYVTRCRQDYEHASEEDFSRDLDSRIKRVLKESDVTRPRTVRFSYEDLINHRYQLPFVFKNENLNRGLEKYLIQTEEDYENLIRACTLLIHHGVLKRQGDKVEAKDFAFDKYFDSNFSVQEYIQTPTEYNTTVRILTSSSNDLLYAALKYKKPTELKEETTHLGFILSHVFPLSTPSIVSNTASGGQNVLLGEQKYTVEEQRLLDAHNIHSRQFESLVEASCKAHASCGKELGIICGFDYIFDNERRKWYLLEYHTKPMVGDYSSRQTPKIPYETLEDRSTAEGRVRATALNKVLQKTR